MSETEPQTALEGVVPPPVATPATFAKSAPGQGTTAQPTPPTPTDVWFARRYSPGDPRNGMGPVNWKGWLAFIVFVGALLFSAMVFLVLAIAGSVLMGVVAFGALGGGALLALMKLVHRKGDATKTMDEYARAKGHVVG